jgi:hypothetical protein
MQENVIFCTRSIAASFIAGLSRFCVISALAKPKMLSKWREFSVTGAGLEISQSKALAQFPARLGLFSAEFHPDDRKTFSTAPAINP